VLHGVREDRLLLLLVCGSLLFGGGFGCDPVLEGVALRTTSVLTIPGDKNSPRDFYAGFTGKKDPGNAAALLPYPLDPPFGVSLRAGVFDPEYLINSQFADACAALERSDAVEQVRLCLSYEYPAMLGVFSNLDANSASCAGDKAELDIDDDGVNTTLRYRCAGDVAFSTLTTATSAFDAGERWFGGLRVFSLGPRGQIGFDDIRITSAAPVSPTDERLVAYQTFEGFRFTAEAFYELEQGDLAGAALNSSLAGFQLGDAETSIVSGIASFPDSDVEKLLHKTNSSLFKIAGIFSNGKQEKYFKAFPKIADSIVCALEEEEPFF